jgi:UDP-2,3-diacylglucosamine pyrophosphatase LpxH
MPAVRSVFISDVHLGTRACQAESLLDFLREYPGQAPVPGGRHHRLLEHEPGHPLEPGQNTVIQKVLKRARHGEQVVFVPGNHDEALRDHCETAFGDIRVEREYVHETADGRRFLLIHGDDFDQVTRHHRWVAVLGDMAYNGLVRLNGWLSGRAACWASRATGPWPATPSGGSRPRCNSFSISRIRSSAMCANAAWTA